MNAKNIINIIKNEYIYSIVMKFFSIGISFLQSILIARYLGAALQGTSTSISSITAIGSIVITFGMHQAYPVLRKKYGKDKILNDFVSTIMAIFSVLLVISLIVGFGFVQDLEIRTAIVLMPLLGYSRIMAYISLVESPNKRNSWWTIINVMEILLVLVLMATVERSIVSAIILLTASDLMKSIVFTGIVKQKPHFHKGLFSLAIELAKLGLLPMLALLMTTLNYKIDILMLRSFPIITDAQLGVYAIGMSMADRVVLIPDTLKGVLVSKLAKGAEADEVAKVSRICFWASVGMCVAFWILGQPVISLLYGDEYTGAYSVLVICSVGAIFVGYFKLIAQYNIVNKKQIRNIVLLSLSIAINCVLNLLLIPKYQLEGAAFASGVGYFLSGIIFVVWFAYANKIPLGKMFLIQKGDVKMLRKMMGLQKK